MNAHPTQYSDVFRRPRMGDLKVSRYDKTNAWLIAGILISGALFLIFAAMLTRQPISSGIEGEVGGKNKGLLSVETSESELVDPLADAPDLATQVIDASLFDQVTDSVSAVRAGHPGSAIGSGGSEGVANVDPRELEPPINSDSRSSRWQISYDLNDIDDYTSQLRHFQIELGVVSRQQNDIWRIADPGKTNLVVHSNRAAESDATYFVPIDSAAKRFDRKLAQIAQAGHSDTFMVHFYPQPTVELLDAEELKSLPAGKTLKHVERTLFRLNRRGDEFEVHVAEFEFK